MLNEKPDSKSNSDDLLEESKEDISKAPTQVESQRNEKSETRRTKS